jgi:hypothetical protein
VLKKIHRSRQSTVFVEKGSLPLRVCRQFWQVWRGGPPP